MIHLDALSRDWIVGTEGTKFRSLVEADIKFIEDNLSRKGEEVVVIHEPEPVAFASMFFAGVFLGVPVALANPKWSELEWDQFDNLLLRDRIARGSILIPTGGTTGGVKLAIHDWASLSASAFGVQEFLGGGPIHSCCLLPLFHVSGLMQLVRSFVTGGLIRFNDEETAGFCLSLVPTQLQRAMQSTDQLTKLRAAKVVFVGGAGMPEAVAQRARDLALPVVPVYGMTETAAMVAAIPNEDFLSNPDAGAVPIGQAELSIEEDGRIRMVTPALFKGYQGRASADPSSGFIVNDEGRIDEDGRLHVIGRVDRLINTGGEKVDPREVERALLGIEGVTEALVVGEADEEWGQLVVAYLVSSGAELDGETIRQDLRSRLASHKIPKRVSVVGRLPVNELGKPCS